MFSSILKATFRSLIRRRFTTLINVTSLTLGLAVCLLIVFWVTDELSYDRFNEKSDRIYRVIAQVPTSTEGVYSNRVHLAPGYANKLKEHFPEIESICRFRLLSDVAVSTSETGFYEKRVAFADSAFFDIFSYPLVAGNPKYALKDLQSITLSREMAQKYFGEGDPMGQVLTLDGKQKYTVTGIFENVSHKSHLQFDFVVPFRTIEPFMIWDDFLEGFNIHFFHHYILLGESADPVAFNEKLGSFISDVMEIRYPHSLSLQSIEDIHLRSKHLDDYASTGSITSVRMFSLIALLVLVLACINSINLTTARADERSLEIGLRRTIGASRVDLIIQFLTETFILVMLSVLLSIVLVELALPTFNELTGKSLSFLGRESTSLFLIISGLALVTLLLSGWPAILLSSFKPTEVLRAGFRTYKGKPALRRVLVVLQLSVATVLLISAVTVYHQYRFMLNKDLGMNQDQVLYFKLKGDLQQKYASLKGELLKSPDIKTVTTVSNIMPFATYTTSDIIWKTDKEYSDPRVSWAGVDIDFVKTFDIEILEGRNFSPGPGTGNEYELLINESAAKLFNDISPVGLPAKNSAFDTMCTIVGVVKDFHTSSMRSTLRPVILHISPDVWNFACVRVQTENLQSTLDFIKETCCNIAPALPFDYGFFDEVFERQYRSESQLTTLLGAFTFLAIIIACLGLLGLISYSIQSRVKEIGIRRILGASGISIVRLLSHESLILSLISILVAWPTAYYITSRWLDNFAYRIKPEFATFGLATLTVVVLVFITISLRTVKAAGTNPVDTLRND